MNNKQERKIRRGDIYLYDFGDNEGSIQCGYRPAVVLQADNFNAKAPTIMVAAITTAIRKTFLPSHEDCNFVLWIGSKRLIKRELLDEYIREAFSI